MSVDVTVLGASGRIAREVLRLLENDPTVHLTLLARNASRITDTPHDARIVEGDATDEDALREAIAGADIVYANLSGPVDEQAEHIAKVMADEGVQRLIFITALGIYDEVPGPFGTWNLRQIGSTLQTYRAAADIVTSSPLDYTNIRPAWLEDVDEINYETSEHDEPFRGTVVSRKSVAALVAAIIHDPMLHSRGDVGVNKPNTDGPTPQFS